MDLKNLMATMGISALFIFGMMTFIITTQNQNSVSHPITDNDLINDTYGDLNTQISSSQSNTQTALNNFQNTTPTQQYGELEISSIISPTRTLQTMTIGLWNIMIKLPQVILGVSPVVAFMISTIIGIILIIGIWAVWKGVVT